MTPQPLNAPTPAFLDAVKRAVGPKGWRDDAETLAPHLKEWRDLWHGRTPLLVMPASVDEVSAVVTLAAEAGVALVPQGGNTGLVGASVPSEDGTELLVSLKRLNRIRAVDARDYSLVAEAGCVLEDVHRAANDVDRLFPLSLASQGSAQIGGLLSTNAGGINVLRYGNARDLVLGLEVVLPDGRVWNGLRRLRKDNTGYALKHLFMGAEGTLGIITAAALKLFARPRHVETAFIAVETPAAAIDLLARLRDACGEMVSAFELMARQPLDFVLEHIPASADPLAAPAPWYVLAEVAGTVPLADRFTEALGRAVEDGLVADAVIAQSGDQRQALWHLRESMSEAQRYEGGSIKHDISVPTSSVPEFLARADAAVRKLEPSLRICAFGHAGDGNIHYNLSQPVGMDKQAYLDRWFEFNRVVHDIVADLDGSFSAEHGIGRLKVGELERYRDPVELDLMRTIKAALDPHGIMNPGRVLRRD